MQHINIPVVQFNIAFLFQPVRIPKIIHAYRQTRQKSRDTSVGELYVSTLRLKSTVREPVNMSLERRPAPTKQQLSDSNKNLILGPRRGLTQRLTGRLTVRSKVTLT
jgi:hypothetical protein